MNTNNTNNDYDRLLSQFVDILIYDYSNNYQILKQKGLNKQEINKMMIDYQFKRNKEFIADINKLKLLIK